MKHQILARPEPNKQLHNFRCSTELMTELKSLADKPYAVVLLESASGNGSSHLLQALSNELRRRGDKVVYLNFKQENVFSDLSALLINDILQTPVLFIDHLDVVFAAHSRQEILAFLSAFSKQKGKLFYSSTRQVEEMEEEISSLFDGPKYAITLQPLSPELRKEWGHSLLGSLPADIELPTSFHSMERSNRDFLHALEPYLQHKRLTDGRDHAYHAAFELQIHEFRVQLRKLQLALAELQLEKMSAISHQHYEKAVTIRDRENLWNDEMRQIADQVDRLMKDVPFTTGLLHLHYLAEVLLHEIHPTKLVLAHVNEYLDRRKANLKDESEDFLSWNQAREALNRKYQTDAHIR